MHFGLPILTSDLDFAKEICGDAAIYFDARNPESMRDAILNLLADPGEYVFRAARARERIATHSHSWDDIAGHVIGSLSQLIVSGQMGPQTI
jgi:glycosyltransferase involved in cell wall biosynthesis